MIADGIVALRPAGVDGRPAHYNPRQGIRVIGRIWKHFSRFWEADRGLTVFLALLVVGVFVIPVVIQERPIARIVGDVVFTLLLVTGAWAVSRKRSTAVVVSASAAAALAIRWTARLAPSLDLAAWTTASSLLTEVLLAAIVLKRVFQAGRINRQRIEGAIAAYLLMGAAWAEAYELVALAVPGAFLGTAVTGRGSQDFVFFSYITLTTVGYGDITPVAPAARSLASMEALVGQLYPAVLLARLVSLETIWSRRGGPGGDDPS
jgi:hypothetical protein